VRLLQLVCAVASRPVLCQSDRLHKASLLFADPADSRSKAKGKGKARDTDLLALDIDRAEAGEMPSGGDGYMQMQLVERQVRPSPELLARWLTFLGRITTSKNVPRPSSLSNPPLPSSDKSLPSSRKWSPSNARRCNESTRTQWTLRTTWLGRRENCSSTMRAYRATGG
jgi:hypothetical protein